MNYKQLQELAKAYVAEGQYSVDTVEIADFIVWAAAREGVTLEMADALDAIEPQAKVI